MIGNDPDALVDFVIAVAVISVTAILLRFWSRWVSPGVRCRWDDWLALAALPPALVLCGTIIGAIQYGAGKPLKDISPADQTMYYKMQYIGAIGFDLSITSSKLSALAFYSRVFRLRLTPSRLWKWSFYITLTSILAWLFIFMNLSIFRCKPVQKYWYPELPGSCRGGANGFIIAAVTSVIVDIMVLVLPLPMIFQLQIKRVRKILIGATFIVGYGAAVMSIGRLVSSAQVGQALLTDFIHSSVPTLYWGVAEACLSIMAICLPAIFQLFNRGVDFGPASLLHSREFSKLDNNQRTGGKAGLLSSFAHGRRGTDWVSNPDSVSTHQLTTKCAGNSKSSWTSDGSVTVGRSGGSDVPLGSIQVRRDFDVSVHV